MAASTANAAATMPQASTARLTAWLRAHVDPTIDGLVLQRLHGGQSNPTWIARAPRRAFVIRAKPGPLATLAPSAHAIEREFRVLQALAGSPVPVPPVRGLCEDESVLGAAFYVMDFLTGRVLRDPALTDLTPQDRTAVFDDAARVLAALHGLDWRALGLADYGRAGGGFSRLVQRWTKQYRHSAAVVGAIDAMERLADWLPTHLPAGADEPGVTTLTHGDFRIENLMFDPVEPRVIAVLDWELSTLGHPMSDLAYQCTAWYLPAAPLQGMRDLWAGQAGIPSSDTYLRTYCARRGLDVAPVLADWPVWLACSLFRLAAILTGIGARLKQGTAAGANAGALAAMAQPVAELGWEIACGRRSAMPADVPVPGPDKSSRPDVSYMDNVPIVPNVPNVPNPTAHYAVWPPGIAHDQPLADDTLWQVWADHAAVMPHAIGVAFLGRTWTWRALVTESERMAGALQVLGVALGDRVVLMTQNCPQYVIAFHAVQRCGAAVVPLNPMYKAEELTPYLVDSGARVAIASSDIAGELVAASAGARDHGFGAGLEHLVVFDLADALPDALLDASATARHPEPASTSSPTSSRPLPAAWTSWLTQRRPQPSLAHGRVHAWIELVARGHAPTEVATSPDDLAVLAYTSGTTGRPKGCMHTHRTLSHNARAGGPWYDMRAGDRTLIVVPMFHVTGLVMGMLASVRHGCGLVILPRWDRLQAADAIARQQVTHWPNIPTMVIDLLAAPELPQFDLSSLRYIGGGGAPMPEPVAERLAHEFGLRYIEGYGLTESAAPTHSNPMNAPRRQCLGIPFVGTQARIVDPITLAVLPAGEVGEILVHGPQLFKGYWKQADATADAFVELDGVRWFRTGDLGRVDTQGYFTLADRLKRMINASGFKVWPAEVESQLYHHPAVLEACVIARRDPYRGETVKAVVVLKDSARGTVTSAELIAWARERMAAYKYPREIDLVDALPRSATGKVMWRTVQERQDAVDVQPIKDAKDVMHAPCPTNPAERGTL